MEAVGLAENVRGVQSGGAFLGAIKVVVEERLEFLGCAVLDDKTGALLGREAAEIGKTTFGDQDLGVVLGVVNVADHGDDGGDGSLGSDGGRHKDGQVGVAGEVAGAADAIHDLGAHDVGGVDVAVDVGFDHAVHGNDAEAANNAGVVGDVLGAEDDTLAVGAQVAVNLLDHVGTERKGSGGGGDHLAGLDELDHAVLNDFGVGSEVLELALIESEENGVGDVSDTGLDGEQVGGHAALLYFPFEEVEDVSGNLLRGFVGLLEGGVAIRRVGLDDGDHLLDGDVEVGAADAVSGAGERDGLAARRSFEAVVDVVHALELDGLPGVDFEDDAVGALEPGFVVAKRSGGDGAAILVDSGDLDDGHVELAEESVLHVLGDVAEMDVDVLHVAVVDAFADGWIGLVREPDLHAVGGGERAVEFGAGGGAGEDADAEEIALFVGLVHAAGESGGELLGIAGAGESAHADIVTVADERGGLIGGHDALAEFRVEYAIRSSCSSSHEDLLNQ